MSKLADLSEANFEDHALLVKPVTFSLHFGSARFLAGFALTKRG